MAAEIIVIPADVAEEVRLETIEMSLEALKGLVGGYIEPLRVPDVTDWVALANEEGNIMGLPENPRAGEILGKFAELKHGVMLVGDIVIVGQHGPEMGSIPAGLWEKVTATV